MWLCRCDCGTQKEVAQGNLGRCIFSCGCLHKELAAASKLRLTHGMRNSVEYATWNSMKNRCFNPKSQAFKNYGGRGITVCERWMKFENFFSDMGPRPDGLEIDRINNNGNYEPDNCRWTTRSVNILNTRERLRNRTTGRWATGCMA
jgi:hypothetical protein